MGVLSKPPGKRGLAAAKYDVKLDEQDMDMTGLPPESTRTFSQPCVFRLGFMVANQYALRIVESGLAWGGLPCSLHVWISRGTSGKSRENPRGVRPDGTFSHSCVKQANMLAARWALLAMLFHVRRVWWLCEQPVSSVAHYLPYIEAALYPGRYLAGFAGGLLQRLPLGF